MRTLPGSGGVRTLLDVLLHAADTAPGQVVVHVRPDGTERTVTHRELRDESLRVAGGYQAAGLAPGTPALLLADAGDDFQPMFWGALAAGLVPVPLPPEPSRVRAVRDLLPGAVVVTDDATARVADGLPGPVLRLAALRAGRPPATLPTPAPDQVAFLQFSSGSTGSPRGVELTHANVLANLAQARAATGLGPDDVLVTWMPYFHDMGLIGTHLTPLSAGVKQVRIPPLAFAKRPELWFTTAHRHRATLLSAANFALALAVRRVPAETLAGLDLSRVRFVAVGAEPISAAVWRAFLAHTRPAGLAPAAPQPVYGLAEATLAVTFPPLGEVAAPLVLDRAELSRGRVVPTGPGPHAVELMDLGHPVAGCALRIVDDRGRPVGGNRVGLIEVRGPNVARRYHRDGPASRETFVDGWLRTGDLGFLRAGRLCVTGRAKDVVFVNGRTFHASDLEEVAATTAGLPTASAAVVGCTDPDTGGERIVVFVPWARPPAGAAGVLDAVRARVAEASGHDDVRVVPLPPGALARTTSGKLRRRRIRERYLAGDFADRERRWCRAPGPAGRPEPTGTTPPTQLPTVAGDPTEHMRATGPTGITGPTLARLSRPEIERLVRQVWARVLDRPADGIGLDDRFLSIGGSSLRAMEVLAGLEDVLGTTVDPADLRDCPTVASLADRLAERAATPPTTAGAANGTGATAEAGNGAGTTDGAGRTDRAGATDGAGRTDRAGATDRPRAVGPDLATPTGSVAVIGMACRFPGAATPEEFWQRLVEGWDAVGPVPAHRWTARSSRWGGFLDDPMLLDADFFGLTDTEARYTDPHARLFLEIGYEALERAGYAGPRRQGRRIGIFAAVGESGYPELLGRDGPPASTAALVGNLRNLVAARLAQALDLTGPAVAVDTACSSALVALHLAGRSLASGECDIAVVGGVNLNLTPTGYRLLDAAEALSPTGRCRAFDAGADGFVPGEGGAALVLCRPADAHAAGDQVLALVAGTAVGNDGRSLSLLAPNPHRQQEVIVRAYREAGIDPARVSYVEAHGTGTPLGDPVEVRSLAHAFPPPADGTSRGLGSVKTNLGHLLNAAGMPALLKVVLALRHRRLPASLHHVRPPTRFDLAAAGFAVVTGTREWTGPAPLVAGINAFGFGGTNAHAILREAPPAAPVPTGPDGQPVSQLVTLSAHTPTALRRAARDLAGHLRAHPELDPADVCASAGTARDDGPYRLAVVAAGDLADRLDAAAVAAHRPVGRRPRTVFLFPGADTPPPSAEVVRDLHDRLPVFRTVLAEVCAAAGPVAGRPLLSWCLAGPSDPAPVPAAGTVLAAVHLALGVALAGQLTAWGVTPDALLGQGTGEFAAAAVAGALTVADAVRLAVGGGDRRPAGPYRVPLFSPAAGRWDPEHWPAVPADPSTLPAALCRLRADGYDTYVELGSAGLLGPGFAGPLGATADGAPVGVPAVPAPDAVTAGGTGALLATVGRLWARGGPLDRSALYAGRRRVPVPTYPFERRAYRPPGSPDPDVPLYRVTWRETPPPGGTLPTRVRLAGPGTGSDFADRLTADLTARGVEVSRDAASGRQDAEEPCPAGPARRAGRAAASGRPDVLVFLAGTAVDPPDVATLDSVVSELVRAFRTLLDGLADDPTPLLVVTEDVQVTGTATERPRPVHGVLAGLTAALADERPDLPVRIVDLSGPDDRAVRSAAVCAELAAFGRPSSAVPAPAGDADGVPATGVAWRGGRRLTRALTEVATPPQRTDPDGVHVLLGGAGGLGAELARHLVRRGHPTLLLAGRSTQPPDALLTELRAAGATVTYHRCDVTVPADVDALLGGLDRLDTVFHAAGTVRVGTLRTKSVPDVLAVLAPKVRGSFLVAETLRRHGHHRTAVVGFSSVSAVLPGLAAAVGDYAAANAFLDAFAAAQRAAGRPFQSVGFAAITDTGMAARAGVLPTRQQPGHPPDGGQAGPAPGGERSAGAVGGLTGRAALRGLLAAGDVDAAHLVVADLRHRAVPDRRAGSGAADRDGRAGPASDDRDTASRTPTAAGAPPPAGYDDAPAGYDDAPPRPGRFPEPSPAAATDPGDAGRNGGDGPALPELAGLLRRLVAEPLHRRPEEIADDTSFLALGLDSLAAVDLVKRLEDELGRQLPVTLFFEYTTVAELAGHLAGQPTGTTAPGTGPSAVPGTRPSTVPEVGPSTGDHAGRPTTPGAGPSTVDGAEAFPLTPVQRAFHVNERFHPTVASYGFVRHTVTGPLDADLLRRALGELENRHPMLRVRFVAGPTAGAPRQVVLPPSAGPTWYAEQPLTGSLAALEERLCNTPVDLTREPPLRAVLVREAPDRAHLVLVMHHAAGDGFSLNLLGAQLWATYTALARGRTPDVPLPAAHFRTYAQGLGAPAEQDLAYWRDVLTRDGRTLRLPYDGTPDTAPAPPYASHPEHLEPALVAGLREHAADAGVSLFHLLLAGYVRCLARWSGQRRIPVNLARAGRDARLPGIERTVGPFADTLPLLVDVDPDEPAGRLADRIRVDWSTAQRHGSVSTLDLARLLDPAGAGPRTASPAGFSFARFPVTRDGDCPVAVTATAAGTASAATRLSLLCWESDATLRFSWNFPTRLFDRATVARLAAEHRRELVALAGAGRTAPATTDVDTGTSHAGVDHVDAGTGQGDAGVGQGDAGTGRPAGGSVAGDVARHLVTGSDDVSARIRAVCRRYPEAVAVRDGTATVTYRGLDLAADRVAARLGGYRVGPGDRVALLTAPGPATVVGIVGILRAGAAWVPLDAGHPPARLRDQLDRAGVGVVLHDDDCVDAAERIGGAARPVRLDPVPTAEAGQPDPVPAAGADQPDPVPAGAGRPGPEPVAAVPAPDDPAYVIFTSGSTGRPKGVPVSRRSMLNYLDWAVTTFGYRPGDRLAQTSSICFDASVRQVLAPLLVGATVVTVPPALRRDPHALLARLEQDRITVWSSVPTLWERILRAAEERADRGTPARLDALRWVHVGGEELSPVPVRRWFDLFGAGCRITNLYGPTEATINATWHLIDRRPGDEVRRLPIGRPVGGAVVRVVDAEGRDCPPGTAGELYLGGVGLTAGYLGEPELTRAAFVFRDGQRFYRSGDRGRVGPDGNLEFLGRLDDQVKIHGYRVEPGEVEAVLRRHPQVTAAVVLHRADPHPRLHAFVRPGPGAAPTLAGLRAHLAASLPDHMVPARIHLLDDLPVTAVGKIDRDRLWARVRAGSTGDGSPPVAASPTGTEQRLARIWCDLLDLPSIGPDDDFFSLGGDSILVLEVFARLREQSPAVPGPNLIYRHRTLAGLAAAIDTAATDPARPPGAGRPVGDTCPAGPAATDPTVPFPVTATQRGFLLADAVSPGAGTAWLARLRLRGSLRRDVFQRAVDVLVARHRMLRTVFPAGVRPPVQQELPASLRLPVGYEVLSAPADLAARVAEERGRRFETWAWPLLRLRLLAVAPDEHVLLVHAHHVIGDGYSVALLGRELLTVYRRLAAGESAGLPELRASFRDYVALLTRRADAPPDPAALAWWSHRFGPPYQPPTLRAGHRPGPAGTAPPPAPPPAPPSPAATPAPARPPSGTAASVAGFTLGTAVVDGLRRLAADAATTLYATVLTGYHRALARYTGQDDLVVGLAVTGRDHALLPDLHRLFGPCAAMLPLRLTGGGGFPAHLARVAGEVTAARQHDDPPSIATLGGTGRRDGAPLGAQFFFSFLDFAALGVAGPAPEAGQLSLDWDDEDTDLAPPPIGTDLFLTARPVPDGLRVTVRASAVAVGPDQLTQLAGWLRDELAAAATAAAPPTTSGRGERVTAQGQPDHAAPPEEVAMPSGRAAPTPGRLDAAIVGYLPPPAQLAALAGLPADSLPRDQLRDLLFPAGGPRLLEELTTPLGTSGFVCLPRFADELTGARESLAAETAHAVDLAADLGARCVSLAGMIPAHTGYGVGVLRRTRAGVAVTTGHAVTAVSVVLTVEAALAAVGGDLAGRTVAVVGLGSIGSTSSRLLLARAARPPARLVLCDVPAAAPRLAAHAARLRADGFHGAVETCRSTPGVPAGVYEADVVIGATSAASQPIDVDRLRPGTIVVDDSFPHALDPARALARMRSAGDLLVVGGGLLHLAGATRTVPVDLPPAVVAGHAAGQGLPATVASCQLEALLWAAVPGLPLVHGPVEQPTVVRYARALAGTGVTAAPLHLLRHRVRPALTGWSEPLVTVPPGAGAEPPDD
ncbi:non-ribosomal peptide synthetase [Micromonospora cathayae]|uniref:Amino acid adenylation domain-containing protein n=1 Tax=Micromonospora cathayae TaxID=3028804 RepID=A0ABY7ZJ23_9ACTN|nr:non-ribosomal peptide synthetase [Micromonospora sp. HUAS 3]WDZ82888.1 amino acid adenylation domain-containing protein [Micromonospora sp. HUAS 3]